MTLPYNIARCEGVSFKEDGQIDWRKGCEDCRRREPGRKQYQSYMVPPEIIAFWCEYRIEPIEKM